MNGWKVLNNRRDSISSYGNYFALTYPVNVEVFPSLIGSKLFFFKEKKDATAFASQYTDILVVKCIAKNPRKQKRIAKYLGGIKYLWENTLCKSDIEVAPPGTYVADSVTCLE